MTQVVAIIPARGGSKGIPNKNIVPFCGKPLLAWSIAQARSATSLAAVWVSSDSDEILAVAERFGARAIKRPAHLADDHASSESAWRHAIEVIETEGAVIDIVVGMQATSPLRQAADLDAAVTQFQRQHLDSLFSCCELEDFFIWKYQDDGQPVAMNHDYRRRVRRQVIDKRYLENGSIYVFTPELLRTADNRLGGRIGMYVMEKHKMFQIDTDQDLTLCEAIMRGYGLDQSP